MYTVKILAEDTALELAAIFSKILPSFCLRNSACNGFRHYLDDFVLFLLCHATQYLWPATYCCLSGSLYPNMRF